MDFSVVCDYEQGEPETYRGIITIDPATHAVQRFDTGPGCFLKDLSDALSWLERFGLTAILRPSVGQFVLDANACQHAPAAVRREHASFTSSCDCPEAVSVGSFRDLVK